MALAAFAVRSGDETLQMQVVCVDDLVSADDDLRRIEVLVDWGHVRETARPFYRAGGAGRSGIDPAVLVKLALVLAWRGLPSMRETLRVARTDMSIRRFLGFGLTERLPDHSTFSHAQTKRFADSSVFEQLFTAVLRQCTDAGLVGGRRLVVDGMHIEADAALKSLRAELSPVEANAGDSAESPRADGDGDGTGRWCTTIPRRRVGISSWPSRGAGRPPSAARRTRLRFHGPIQTPSFVTSPDIESIWSIAARSLLTPRRG